MTLHKALTGLRLSVSADSAGGLRLSIHGKKIVGSFASPGMLRYVYTGIIPLANQPQDVVPLGGRGWPYNVLPMFRKTVLDDAKNA